MDAASFSIMLAARAQVMPGDTGNSRHKHRHSVCVNIGVDSVYGEKVVGKGSSTKQHIPWKSRQSH